MTSFRVILTNLLVHLLQSLTAATMHADKYGHLHHPDCRNTLIYMHMTLCTLPTRAISLGSLMLPAPEAGDFVEILLLYPVSVPKLYCSDNFREDEIPGYLPPWHN